MIESVSELAQALSSFGKDTTVRVADAVGRFYKIKNVEYSAVDDSVFIDVVMHRV